MDIGFTGTQNGMTQDQRRKVMMTLAGFIPAEGLRELIMHHGDCIGADAQVHEICREYGYSVVIHPPQNPQKRAFCFSGNIRRVWEEKPYLNRNMDIVGCAELMIAAPGGHSEKLRSGTWATVRYARYREVSLIIVWPDGTTTEERRHA